jgi:hypothetical protein
MVRHEYELHTFHEGEGVEDFTMRLAWIVHQLAMLGDLELDDKVVLKYLRIARPRYRQLVLSIETLLDVSTLSIEEITGRLKAVKDDVVKGSAMEGKLLLSEEEWHKRSKKKEISEGSRGGSSGDRDGHGGGGGNLGRGRGHGDRGEVFSASGGHGNSNCHCCGKPGHWARDYRSKQPKKNETAFMAQEEEKSFLLTEVDSVQAAESVGIGVQEGGPVDQRSAASYGE